MLGCVGALQSCSDDTLTGQPSWLGNSIYEELQKDGKYTVTLKLIDDLGYHDQMSKTGSLTIFVANDDTYGEWFKTNKWGVRSYEGLSTAQKKMLLNNAIVNNAYLIELLTNEDRAQQVRERVAQVAETFRWRRALQPLVDFCASPRRAADHERQGQVAVGTPGGSSLLDAARRDLRAAVRVLRSQGGKGLVAKVRWRLARFRR